MTTELITQLLNNLGTIRRNVRNRFQSAAHAVGISPLSAEALYTISREQPITPKQLATQMFLQPAAVTQITENLVRAGFLTRRQSETDRRIWFLELTDSGKETISRFDLQNGLHVAISKNFTEAEVKKFIELEEMVIEHLKASSAS